MTRAPVAVDSRRSGKNRNRQYKIVTSAEEDTRVLYATIDQFRNRFQIPASRVRTINVSESFSIGLSSPIDRAAASFKYQFPGDNFSVALGTLLLTIHMEMEIGHRNPVCEWKHPERVSRLIRSFLFRASPFLSFLSTAHKPS